MEPANQNQGGDDQGGGQRAPLFGGNITGEKGPIFDRQVPDAMMNVNVPPRPSTEPNQPVPQAPQAPGVAPQVPGQPQPPVPGASQPAPAPAPVQQPPAQPAPQQPAPQAPQPAAGGDAAGAEPSFTERLEQARQRFDGGDGGGDAGAGDGSDPAGIAQRVAQLEGQANASGQPPTMPAAQRDAEGNLIGDPNIPWDQPGSSNEPPSWGHVIQKAGEVAVEGFMKQISEGQEKQAQQQQQADTTVRAQVDALYENKIITNEAEKRDLVNVAIKYGQTDLFKAAELWEQLGRPGDASSQRQQQVTQQRAQVFGNANQGGGPAQATDGKPTYQQIHGRSMDDIMMDSIQNLDRSVR